jgi:trigger factor
VTAATVKRLDPTQVELEIPIDPNDLANEQERAFRELSKNVRMPGFRPGKVPRKLFEAQYGSAQIQERAMEAVVGKAYPKALEENDLDPVDSPQMELLPEEEGQPVRVRATVAVRPQIELGDYKGIELEGPSASVSDADVENALKELRKDGGTLVPVDRAVALGDVPTIDYEGKIDGVPFDGGKAENQPTEISRSVSSPASRRESSA